MGVDTLYLPPDLRSTIALNTVKETIQEAGDMAENQPNGIFAAMLPAGRDLWSKLRAAYCYYHPQNTYIELNGTAQSCPKERPLLDEGTLNDEFNSAMIFHTNYLTFLNAMTAERLDAERQAAQPVQPEVSYPALPSYAQSDQKSSGSSQCARNISFAVAGHEQFATEVPRFAEKWVAKNQKKYPGTCFSQMPVAQAENYLLVFANSASAFNGIYPTVRASTNTNTSPVSGTGTVTDNYGGMWYYTYNGTVTTTTTTSENVDLPYTDVTNTLYLYSYDQQGILRSERWRSVTTRNGGDPYNTLGYNLGSALAAVHMRERLLKDSVEDITKHRK